VACQVRRQPKPSHDWLPICVQQCLGFAFRSHGCLEVFGISKCLRSMRQSIFVGQQNTGRGAVGFGNHPEPVPRIGAVRAQEPEAVTK